MGVEMTLKQKILHAFYKNKDRWGNSILSWCNFKSPLIYKSSTFDKKDDVDLIVVAFNDLKLLQYQHELMKKYVKNGATIICDNSNNPEKAQEIYQFCRENDITYIKVPHFLREDPSRNHARALNWIMKNVVFKREKNFLILDHDIFPFAPVDVKDYFAKPAFGKIARRGEYWYFPPIFCGFAFDFWKNFKPNFLPCRIKKHRLDTGGKNYLRIYQHLSADDYTECVSRYINIHTLKPFDFCDASQDEYHDRVEIIDNRWFHLCGGSFWGGKHNKFELAQDYIKTLEKRGNS